MMSTTWHAEKALLLLMSGGFFVHLINASRHLRDERSQVGDILLRPVDGALFLLMAYCAIALLARSRQFAHTYDLTTKGRKLGYWRSPPTSPSACPATSCSCSPVTAGSSAPSRGGSAS